MKGPPGHHLGGQGSTTGQERWCWASCWRKDGAQAEAEEGVCGTLTAACQFCIELVGPGCMGSLQFGCFAKT